jgi:LDH2 family malate/lactate/ureidoglycolate dehydrogenase
VIERANRYGIGCAIVSRANHFGAAAYYANLMADAGLFGIAVCNTDKAMGPPFGGRRVLGTNPLAIAVPLPAAERPQLDMATSEASFGKVLLAVQDKHDIPLGWAVDAHGHPTTSAADAVDGALLPTGGPKGFGIAFMIDALVALSGATMSPEAKPMYGDRSQPQELGLAFIAIRADAAVSPDDYAAAIRGLVSAVHASGPGPTGVEALAPGEPELARQASAGSGIELSDELLEDLRRIGTLTSVDLP